MPARGGWIHCVTQCAWGAPEHSSLLTAQDPQKPVGTEDAGTATESSMWPQSSSSQNAQCLGHLTSPSGSNGSVKSQTGSRVMAIPPVGLQCLALRAAQVPGVSTHLPTFLHGKFRYKSMMAEWPKRVLKAKASWDSPELWEENKIFLDPACH